MRGVASDTAVCMKAGLVVFCFVLSITLCYADVNCGSIFTCADGHTCCPHSIHTYVCCPATGAVCCGDDDFCCPSGTSCDYSKQACTKGYGTIFAKLKTYSFH
ncbi:progranulin-like isoform X2 [Tachypleus tridentatus]|uniref:progranulin-like isoform X2 n=1 Tax=Tachypleus tridentatus TaxID=6853 RepID=UPI003FD52979